MPSPDTSSRRLLVVAGLTILLTPLGGLPTAAAVLSDLVAIARGVGSTWAGSPAAIARSGIAVRPVAAECVAAPSGACYPVGD